MFLLCLKQSTIVVLSSNELVQIFVLAIQLVDLNFYILFHFNESDNGDTISNEYNRVEAVVAMTLDRICRRTPKTNLLSS